MLKDTSTHQLYDKPLLAALIGSIAAIAKAIITLLGRALGLAPWDIIRVSAAILTHNQVKGVEALILGWLVTLFVGAIVGMLLYFSLYLMGQDYLLLKSIGVGTFVWFFDTSVLAIRLGIPIYAYKNFFNHLVLFVSGIVYGIAAWYLLKKFIFKDDRKTR